MDLERLPERTRALLEASAGTGQDILCNLALNAHVAAALKELEALLAFMEERKDCSDFKAHVLLRAWRLFRQKGLLPDPFWERVQRTLLELPYRDFAADNRMLHRSENHRLCFHSAELLTAETWPGATFRHTGRPALEHFYQARNDLLDWTQWVGTYGSGEWDSSTYYSIDYLSLLDVFDFSADDLMRRRAQWVLDKLTLDLALKSCAGVYGGSQGRCYTGTLLHPLPPAARGPHAV